MVEPLTDEQNSTLMELCKAWPELEIDWLQLFAKTVIHAGNNPLKRDTAGKIDAREKFTRLSRLVQQMKALTANLTTIELATLLRQGYGSHNQMVSNICGLDDMFAQASNQLNGGIGGRTVARTTLLIWDLERYFRLRNLAITTGDNGAFVSTARALLEMCGREIEDLPRHIKDVRNKGG
jgi:hypothetical protein